MRNEVRPSASGNQDLPFDWFSAFDRDGLRTRYRPRTRAQTAFFSVAPWFDVLVLAVSIVLFSRVMAVIPGTLVELPVYAADEGLRASVVIVAKAVEVPDRFSEADRMGVEEDDGARVRPIGMTVFFDDERFNLAQTHQIASFRNAIAQRLVRSGETDALLYLDKAISHENSMALALLLQESGIQRVLYVAKAP